MGLAQCGKNNNARILILHRALLFRDPSPALEYAVEVTEDSIDLERPTTPLSEGRRSSSGRLTPRPVPSEHAASIHESETVVKRERTVSGTF